MTATVAKISSSLGISKIFYFPVSPFFLTCKQLLLNCLTLFAYSSAPRRAKTNACDLLQNQKETFKFGALLILSCDKLRSHFAFTLLVFAWFWADISYKRDNKFNRNTLKLNSLPHKVLDLHMFTPRNINSTNNFVSYIIRSYVNEYYDANLRDLGLRVYSTLLPRSHAEHFPLKLPYFSSPKQDLFACTITSSQIQIFLYISDIISLHRHPWTWRVDISMTS